MKKIMENEVETVVIEGVKALELSYHNDYIK